MICVPFALTIAELSVSRFTRISVPFGADVRRITSVICRRRPMNCCAIAGVVLAGAVLGCSSTQCVTLPTPVVQATITDSITNAPAAFHASLIVAGDGVYDSTFVGARPDSLTASTIVSSPPGRTGEYSVRVRRSGYRLWESSVHVEGSGCSGARSVLLAVRLQPLP